MRHTNFALFAGATTVVLALMSATAASAEPRRCAMAKQWVQNNCSFAPKKYGKEGNVARCAKAQSWVKDRCTVTAKLPKAASPGNRAPVKHRAYVVANGGPPAARDRGPQLKWQGWEASCCGTALYVHGYRNPGGSPYGPASVHNNLEGGFHPTVFFRQNERFGLASQ